MMKKHMENIRDKYLWIRDNMKGYDARLVLFTSDREAVLFADDYDVEETFYVCPVEDFDEFKMLVTGLRFNGCKDLIYEEV